MNRAETTAMLSALVEKRLDSRTSYWAREVSFDRGTPNWRRIDYVGFKPYTPNYAVEPISVELGIFSCYEVKSCLADFESGNGLTFYGDENFFWSRPVNWRNNCMRCCAFLGISTKFLCPLPRVIDCKNCMTCPITGVPVTVTVLRVKCCMR